MVAARKPVRGDHLRLKVNLGLPAFPGWCGIYEGDEGGYMRLACDEHPIHGASVESNWALVYVAEVTVEPKDPTWTP